MRVSIEKPKSHPRQEPSRRSSLAHPVETQRTSPDETSDSQPHVEPVAVQAKLKQAFDPTAQRSTLPQPVQLSRSHDQPTPEQIHEAAKLGISGPGGPLPYLDQIQRAFGHHDLSTVVAHTDEQAAQGARAMGAEAFTTGNHIAFAGTPTLHTAAHEAAHVIQQRAGVQLLGGVGQAGDEYEREADEVAHSVSADISVEKHLDASAGPNGQLSQHLARAPIQRSSEMEHLTAGNRATAGIGDKRLQNVLLSNHLSCTLAEIYAMGDWFRSPQELLKLAATPPQGTNGPLQGPGTNLEVKYVLDVQVRGVPEQTWLKDESDPSQVMLSAPMRLYWRRKAADAANYRQLDINFDNPEHFVPEHTPSPEGAKRKASGTTFHDYHLEALRLAFNAGISGNTDDLDLALIQEGFAGHFLQDSFSSGHIMAPRQNANDYWDQKYPNFSINVRWWMAQQIARGMVKEGPALLLYGGALANLSSKMHVAFWGSDSIAYAMGAKDNVDSVFSSTPDITFGDVVGLALHDYHNQVKINVKDTKGKKLAGDLHLNENQDAMQRVVDATKASLEELLAMEEAGRRASVALRKEGTDRVDSALAAAVGEYMVNGKFQSELLIPEIPEEDFGGEYESPDILGSSVWQKDTVEQLLALKNQRFVAAIQTAVEINVVKKIDEKLSGIVADKPYLGPIVQKYIIGELGSGKLVATLLKIIHFVPSDSLGDNAQLTYLREVYQGRKEEAPEIRKQRPRLGLNIPSSPSESAKRVEGLTLAQKTTIFSNMMESHRVSAFPEDDQKWIITILETSNPSDRLYILHSYGQKMYYGLHGAHSLVFHNEVATPTEEEALSIVLHHLETKIDNPRLWSLYKKEMLETLAAKRRTLNEKLVAMRNAQVLRESTSKFKTEFQLPFDTELNVPGILKITLGQFIMRMLNKQNYEPAAMLSIGTLSSTKSGDSKPGSSAAMPSGLPIRDFGDIELGLTFKMPSLKSPILELAEKQSEFRNWWLTGKSPSGSDAIDIGSILQLGYGVVGILFPDIVNAVSNKLGATAGSSPSTSIQLNIVLSPSTQGLSAIIKF